MIRFFPHPYDGEILYSAVARAGSYLGLGGVTLMRVMFGRIVSASIEPAGYLADIEARLGNPRLDLHHTLRPLTQPFGKRRSVLRNRWLRYCPHCVKEQLAEHGEVYWRTDWQIKEIKVCPKHGFALRRSQYHAGTGGKKRHFVDLNAILHEPAPFEEPDANDDVLIDEALGLLTCGERLQPKPEQWMRFYQDLIPQLRFDCYGEFFSPYIYEAVEDRWGHDWLQRHGLLTAARRNCCFYDDGRWLYHLMLIRAFAPDLTLVSAVKLAAKLTD